MKIYYCVTSTFYDGGRCIAAITDSKEAETKPEHRHTEKRDRDIYNDWFDDLAEAKKFVADVRSV